MASSVKKKRRQKSNLLTDVRQLTVEEEDVDQLLALIAASGERVACALRLKALKASFGNQVERMMEMVARARASGHFDHENGYAVSVKQWRKQRAALVAPSASVVKKLIGERVRGKPKRLAG